MLGTQFGNVEIDEATGEFRCDLGDEGHTVVVTKTLYEMECALDLIAARMAAMN